MRLELKDGNKSTFSTLHSLKVLELLDYHSCLLLCEHHTNWHRMHSFEEILNLEIQYFQFLEIVDSKENSHSYVTSKNLIHMMQFCSLI